MGTGKKISFNKEQYLPEHYLEFDWSMFYIYYVYFMKVIQYRTFGGLSPQSGKHVPK